MENTNSENKKPSRILSVDTLRGFDMFWISGGEEFFLAMFAFLGWTGISEQLHHASWSGFHFYDLIFPLFMFLVGVSMPLSITRRLQKGESKKDIYKHVIKRVVLLYLLGMIYNGSLDLDFENFRYSGVLHRIAFAYMFAAFIIMNFKQKGQIIWIFTLTLGYWLLLLLVPVPGYGAYKLTPEGNLCAFIDQQILPGRFCCYGFGDSEGILSNFPSIASVLVGVLAGNLLISHISHTKKIKQMLIAGIVLIVVALLWNFIYPINKYLWTGSFVSITSGISLILLSLCYWIIDVKGYTKWTFPFRVYGMNSITIYIASGIFDFGIIAKIFVGGFYTGFGDFATTFLELSIMVVKWLFLYFLYRKNIFLKV